MQIHHSERLSIVIVFNDKTPQLHQDCRHCHRSGAMVFRDDPNFRSLALMLTTLTYVSIYMAMSEILGEYAHIWVDQENIK